MKRMNLSAVAVAVVFVGVGCTGQPPGYKPKPPPEVKVAKVDETAKLDIIPLVEGNSWTYDVEQTVVGRNRPADRTEYEMVIRVVSVREEPNRKLATLEFLRNGEVTDTQVWSNTDKGLFQNSMGIPAVAFNPPQPMITFPLEDGKRFTWSGRGQTPLGRAAQMRTESRISGKQVVDVGTSRVEAVPVTSLTTFTLDNRRFATSSTSFFHPGIGLVRYRQELGGEAAGASTTLRLREYKVGG